MPQPEPPVSIITQILVAVCRSRSPWYIEFNEETLRRLHSEIRDKAGLSKIGFSGEDEFLFGIPIVLNPLLPEDSWRLVNFDG